MQFLALLMGVSAAARLAFVLMQRRQRKQLQAMARDWRMHYSPRDHFDLADRVAGRFPLSGIAEVRVADVIYGTEDEFYRYFFSTEYTVGVTRAKHRVRRVVTFREPRSRRASDEWSPLILAPEELPIIEQYQKLKEDLEATNHQARITNQ
jgi:hypothetical protein